MTKRTIRTANGTEFEFCLVPHPDGARLWAEVLDKIEEWEREDQAPLRHLAEEEYKREAKHDAD